MKQYSHSKPTGLQLAEIETFSLIALLSEIGRSSHPSADKALHFRRRLIIEMGRTYPEWEKILNDLPEINPPGNGGDSLNEESENTDYDTVDGW